MYRVVRELFVNLNSKHMKSTFWSFILLCSILFIVACDETESILPTEASTGSVESIEISSLPASIQSTVDASEIVEATKVTASDGSVIYGISLSDGTELSFTERGEHCDTVSIASLPADIEAYVTTNFPDEVITKAVSRTNDDNELVYIIRISSGEILAFDEAGEFLYEKVRGNRGHGHRNRHADLIEVSDLPQTTQDYLSTNHSSEIVEKAFSITKRDGTVIYGVKLATGEALFFDESGTYLSDFTPGWGR